jgi:hypothetical protein
VLSAAAKAVFSVFSHRLSRSRLELEEPPLLAAAPPSSAPKKSSSTPEVFFFFFFFADVFFFFALSSRKGRLATSFDATGVFSCAGVSSCANVVVACGRVAARRGFRLWRRARGSASARPRVRPAGPAVGVPRF